MTLAPAIRPVLWIGAVFNAAVALGLLFPLVPGLAPPSTAPVFHTWTLAYFVALFGATYAWLARQPVIPRPLVALAAIGKAGVFVIALACLLRGDIGPPLFAVAVVDLLFALAFLAWLRAAGTR
jgi:hypothetical protein